MIFTRALSFVLNRTHAEYSPGPGCSKHGSVLTSVKYHGNLYILIPLNQGLALTRLRATGLRAVKGPEEFFSLERYGRIRMDMDIYSIENLQTTHRFASAGAHD